MKANYEEDKVIVSATEPTGVNRKKVWFKKGKNITNIPFALDNKKIMTATYDDYYETTDYSVYLIAGKTYTLSFESDGTAGSSAGTDTVQIMLLLDKKYDTMFYSTDSKILTFTVAISGNYYFRFDINKNGCTHSFWNIQLEQNTVATPYEAYVEPEIYILNNNNVYEKFEKNENKEKILFESSDGIPGDITLTDNITNYSYLEIYYKQNDGTYGYTKCVAHNNAHIDLTVNHITNNGYSNSFSSRTINIYNNTIKTLNTNRYISGNITSDNNLSGTTTTNNIYITKVVGYK